MQRKVTDLDGAVMSAIGNWTSSKVSEWAGARLIIYIRSPPVGDCLANRLTHTQSTPSRQDATAGLEDPTHQYIGSMGYLGASGRAYYVTLLGK